MFQHLILPGPHLAIIKTLTGESSRRNRAPNVMTTFACVKTIIDRRRSALKCTTPLSSGTDRVGFS